jgi:hypothetical protein
VPTVQTRVEPLRSPTCVVQNLYFVDGRFASTGPSLAEAFAPDATRSFAAGGEPPSEPRERRLGGTSLVFLEDKITGHMITHYFHILEHLMAVWPAVAERRDAVERIVLASDGRDVGDWRGPNQLNEKLLRALFPRAEVLTWPQFRALGDALLLDEAIVADRARTLYDPVCQAVNKMLGHYRNAFSRELWRGLADAVLDGLGVARRRSDKLRVTHVLRSRRRLTPPMEAELHAAIEALPGVELEPIDFAAIPYEEQLLHAASSDVLLGVHGNGLSHALFLPPGAAVVEIFPLDGHAFDYRFFAEFRGLDYLGLHPVHGVVDAAAAQRLGSYGTLRGDIEQLDLAPMLQLLRERAERRARGE